MKNFLLLFTLTSWGLQAQQLTQTVKGKITDKESGSELPGVIVAVKGDSTNRLNAQSDINGTFRIANVPVGRRTLVFTMTGYKPYVATDVIVTSGKELVLNAELEEMVQQMDEVVVKADDKGIHNEAVSVSVKTFSIEETERYPGSRQDPARMASNFAGVQGTNDARNDIVIRGNSPSGLLWRLEEIDIPNPNHFAVAGSAGGPVSIINNKYLANSEFFTGAFPSFYANALGGVFDLKMRNGNNEKHERTFQLGFLGTELGLEGPISKKTGASYLFNYRYSTLDLFSSLKVPIGTSAVPKYQDMGFRLNFPTKKFGNFSLSGIGGLSNISIILSKDTVRPKELYGDQNRDQFFRTNMGVMVLNHTYSINEKTLVKTSLGYSVSDISSDHYLILRDSSYKPASMAPHILNYQFFEHKATITSYVKRKINARNSFRTGAYFNNYFVDFYDRIKINSVSETNPSAIEAKPWKKRQDVVAAFYNVQPFFHYTHKRTDNLTFNFGVTGQYLSIAHQWSVEPRAGLKWNVTKHDLISVGYGLHSQQQSTYIYFAVPDSLYKNGIATANTSGELSNKSLGFSKAHHFVVGYDHFFSTWFRMKVEAYYQYLFNIPVYAKPSSVSLINRGAVFTRFYPIYNMTNKGSGYNYGLELTLEKLFHKHYFVLFSGSVFDSKFTGSNGLTLNTDYNGRFMTNLLAGVEYHVGKKQRGVIKAGPKLTYGGGRLYSPADRVASDRIMDVVPIDSLVNSLQFPNYFRLDLRLAYQFNAKKSSWEFAFDLINVSNQRNVLGLAYAPDPANPTADPLVRNYQLGFLPIFYIKVDF